MSSLISKQVVNTLPLSSKVVNDVSVDVLSDDLTIMIQQKLDAEGLGCVTEAGINSGSIAQGSYSYVQGVNSFAFGDSICAFNDYSGVFGKDNFTGMKTLYYVGIDFSNNVIYLSSDEPGAVVTSGFDSLSDESFSTGLKEGDKLSFTNDYHAYDNSAVVLSLSGNAVSVDQIPFNHVVGEQFNAFSYDNPMLTSGSGATSCRWIGRSSFAVGESCSALNDMSFAEGLSNTAYGQFSHAEGCGSFAGYASHSEGMNCHADGHFSHAQGFETSALNRCSFSTGRKTSASGEVSFAAGNCTTASGHGSFAVGGIKHTVKNIDVVPPIARAVDIEYAGGTAAGDASFAAGIQTSAIGRCSIAEGWNSNAIDDCSYVWSAISTDARASHGDGTFTIWPMSEDANGVFIGDKSLSDLMAESVGDQLSVYLDKRTGGTVSGNVEVKNALKVGESIEQGFETSAVGQCSFAAGWRSAASADSSFTIGRCSRTLDGDDNSFVWQGKRTDTYYDSKGPGTFCLNPDNGTSGIWIGDKTLDQLLSVDVIDSKYDKTGGAISGDLTILSGNYVQTNTPLNVNTYSFSNSFMQANIDSQYGDSYVGSKVFCVVGVVSADNQIVLSGDIDVLKDIVENGATVRDFCTNVEKSRSLTRIFSNYDQTTLSLDTPLSDAMFSLTLDDKTASIKYHISAVDVASGKVTLVEPLSNHGFDALDGKDSSWFIDKFNNDDNSFYLVGFPEVGNTISKNLFGQHAEGGSVRAIGRQTHVEGRDTIADMRYSHAEGSHNIAGDMASHAEGFVTEANGRYSHSEGFKTIASGIASHAEGESTVASGKNSHAGGWESKAYGDWSFAQGRYAEASSYSTVAAGAYVSAYATNTIAMGTYALADDKRAFVWNGLGNSPSSGYYSSNGDSTFNINPLSGEKGFYIGLSSLDDYLKRNVENASDYVKDHELSDYVQTSSMLSYNRYVDSLQMNIISPFEEQNGWIKNNGTWGYAQPPSVVNETFKFIAVPVSVGQEISVTASNFNPVFMTLLSSDRCLRPVNDQLAGVIAGWRTPHNDYNGAIAINQTSSFIVPDSATMMWCCTKFYGAEATPNKIVIDGIEITHTYAQNSINIDKAVNSNLSSYGCMKSSKTANQFNKDDSSNIDRYFLSAGTTSFIYAKAPAVASQYFGTTHFIPCCKDNVLVCAAKSMASTGGRQVIRAIQYFDANFNLLSCASGQSKEAVGFNAVPRSSFIEHAVWWQKVAVDGCRYVKLGYDWENKDKFVVQVEDSNYTPNELTAYVPFIPNTSDINQSTWSNKKILFAGDSITRPLINDYSSDQPIETDKGLAKKGYTEFVCDKLNCTQFKDSTTAWDGAMLALSSPNAQTSGRRSLVTNISSWPDDVDAVHVMIGTNDWNYAWPDLGSFNDLSDINYDNLSTFYGALDYACRELLEKYPGKPIAFSTPIKRWQNGGFDVLSDIAPSKGWITNNGTWNNGAYQYKLIPILHPNLEIEIKGSSHPSCDTWYTFLSCWPRTSGYAGVYAPTSPLSAYTPGQNRIVRGTVKTFTSPPISSYLWITYSRNDQTSYGSDAGNAWPTYIKIDGIDVTAPGYKVPHGLRYDMPNSKVNTLEDFVKAIKDVCGYYGIKVIDLFNECPINPIIYSHLQKLIPDGTHPTPRGHELIAKYVAGGLNAIM